MPPYLIAGVDPGTTTGLACIDFSGTVIELFSGRHMGGDAVIDHLVSTGKVSLVATDVAPPPESVAKIASSLGAPLHAPPEPLSVAVKNDLTRDLGTGDVHQRDALAAALAAYNHFKNKFENIEARGYGDDVKALVLQGISVEAAAEFLSVKDEPLTPHKESPPPYQPSKKPSPQEQEICRLQRHIDGLKQKIARDEKEMRALTDEIASVKRRYRVDLHRDEEIKTRQATIKHLESSLQKQHKKAQRITEFARLWRRLGEGEIAPVGVYPRIYRGLTLLKRRLKKGDLEKIKGADIVYVADNDDKRAIQKAGIKVADPADLTVVEDCYYVTGERLDAIKRRGLQRDTTDIVSDYREERGKNKK